MVGIRFAEGGVLSHWLVLSNPTFRRLLPGMTLSYLGDGISVVAVVLLAQELTTNAALVGVAVMASSLPGAVGALVLGRVLQGRSGAGLAYADSVWRFLTLGSIPLAYTAGVLGVGLFIGLLAASSVLHSWGSAGRYTLIAEILPQRQHLAGNSLLAILSEAGTIAGPPVAALLLVFWNPAGAIAVDALTFGVLALSYRVVKMPARPTPAVPSRQTGLAVIRRNPALLGLIVLSAAFFFLFGPVYVALPTLVQRPDGTALALATFYSAFGVGAVLGGLITPYLSGFSQWRITVSGVLVAGLCLLPLGLGAATPASMVGFALVGLSWAPYQATSIALYQRLAPADRLAQVLAADSAVALLAVPAGTAVGGLAVEYGGAQGTLLVCATALVGLAGVAALLLTCGQKLCSGPGNEPDFTSSR